MNITTYDIVVNLIRLLTRCYVTRLFREAHPLDFPRHNASLQRQYAPYAVIVMTCVFIALSFSILHFLFQVLFLFQ